MIFTHLPLRVEGDGLALCSRSLIQGQLKRKTKIMAKIPTFEEIEKKEHIDIKLVGIDIK